MTKYQISNIKNQKFGILLFIFWALFVLGSYIFFLLQRGIPKWSNWQF